MLLSPHSTQEIVEIINSLNNFSVGDDNKLKISSEVIAQYLSITINCSTSQGVFPVKLSKVTVIPIHKCGFTEKNIPGRLPENSRR